MDATSKSVDYNTIPKEQRSNYLVTSMAIAFIRHRSFYRIYFFNSGPVRNKTVLICFFFLQTVALTEFGLNIKLLCKQADMLVETKEINE